MTSAVRKYLGITKRLLWILVAAASPTTAGAATSPDFESVAPIFATYCAGCHNDTDREGGLSIESFEQLMQGGDAGPAIVPGKASESKLVQLIEAKSEPIMPPEGNERPSAAEIASIRAWIDAGAPAPRKSNSTPAVPATPPIAAAEGVREAITSLALTPDGTRLALGRYRRVDLVDPHSGKIVAATPELSGKVNSVRFSNDGTRFVAGAGDVGHRGAAYVCSTSNGAILLKLDGHRDSLYDARLSPDGKLLATCSYDRSIQIWDAANGQPLRTLAGHNGAVFELAFSPDGALVASASADDTIKIWRTDTGERLDTLGQPEGAQAAVAISPDSRTIVSGGADRKLRVWNLVSRDKPRVNPLVYSRTAHDSPVVELAYSPDGSLLVSASEGRELLLWDASTFIPIHNYEPQSDVVTGITFRPDNSTFFVARMDGTWQQYETRSNRPESLAIVQSPDVKPVLDAPAVDASLEAKAEEQEPNDSAGQFNEITAHARVRGTISPPNSDGKSDVDVFRFHAAKGQRLVLEIVAARNKSPLDSRLEVLDDKGSPIPRVLLQSVRETYFTFRGHNSTDASDFRLHGWQDMELNQFLYANGEVSRLWMYPRGPDSGFLVYPGVGGSRYAYFGTSALAHPLNEPCYIVEAHPPGTTLIPNGLPQYTIYYENDDDGWRHSANDSRVMFTAPADGNYLVRVSDIRGSGGNNFNYELVVRPPRPDFSIRVEPKDLTINAASGKEFTVVADRFDEFEGEIQIELEGLPPGFHASTPLVIEAEQTHAYGVITADAHAPPPTAANNKQLRLRATAIVDGKKVTKPDIELGEVKLGEKPKLLVRVLPIDGSPAVSGPRAAAAPPVELTIAPGESIAALVKIERAGFDSDVPFGAELTGRNLPHGVFIDNIGLNGLMLLGGESERRFFITAAKWVPETTRMFHLRTTVEGNQTSLPVVLRVRKPGGGDADKGNLPAAQP